jgi:hypothetical protein
VAPSWVKKVEDRIYFNNEYDITDDAHEVAEALLEMVGDDSTKRVHVREQTLAVLCVLLDVSYIGAHEELIAAAVEAKGAREALALIAGALGVGVPGERPNADRVLGAVRSLVSLLNETERQRAELAASMVAT